MLGSRLCGSSPHGYAYAQMKEQNTPERIVFTRISGEIARQLEEGGAPEDVHDFFKRRWSLLMTRIFLSKGNQAPDWQAGWDTMNALLWTLSPKHGRKETTLMLRALPNVLARLHEGCDAIDLPAQERDALFERLALLHAAVAREGLHGGRIEARPDGPHVEEPLDEVDISRLTPAVAQGHVGSFLAPGEDRVGMPALKVGDRVVLNVGVEERELILSWVSPMQGMYMFTNDQGLDALTLTRARLQAKFRAGEAHLGE